MNHLFLRYWLRPLRRLAAGLIALGMVLQPVVATAAELHALDHPASALHDHDFSVTARDAGPAAGDAVDQARAGALHAMLHFAHCCGATAALPPVPGAIPGIAPVGLPAATETTAPPPARPGSLFRPPIRR